MDASEMRRTERKLLEAEAAQAAASAWAEMTSSQKTASRFGMTDIEVMRKWGGMDGYKTPRPEFSSQFTLALMECAKNDGGMRA